MKNNVILPIIFIIFFGSLYFIQLSKDAKKEQTINSVIPIITNADDIGPEELKEIKTGIFENEKYTLVFEEITKEEYENKYNIFNILEKSKNKTLSQSQVVSKNGNCFDFKFEDGKTDQLCNVKNDDQMDRIYSFVFEKNGFISMNVLYWEGAGNILINTKTGQKINTFGNPIISPNNTKILALRADLEAGYDPNGLQMFSIDDVGNVELEWKYEQYEWMPEQAIWANDSVAYIKKRTPVYIPESGLSEVISYIKITIIENIE